MVLERVNEELRTLGELVTADADRVPVVLAARSRADRLVRTERDTGVVDTDVRGEAVEAVEPPGDLLRRGEEVGHALEVRLVQLSDGRGDLAMELGIGKARGDMCVLEVVVDPMMVREDREVPFVPIANDGGWVEIIRSKSLASRLEKISVSAL